MATDVHASDGDTGSAEHATAVAAAISALPSGFMFDPATYRHGASMGFDGIDFYFLGRGGALGDVPGPVVAAALIFFEPGHVVAAWERGRKVASPAAAAEAFAGCLVRWADDHLPSGPDYRRLAELAGRLTAAASPAAAPLFAAWREVPEPERPGPLALHRLNLLRELQGAWHGAAVLTEGLTCVQAVAVRSPHLSTVFGWGDQLPDTAPLTEAWGRAQRATEAATGRLLAVLPPAERAELRELLAAATPR